MERHIYRPPRGNRSFNMALAIIGGLIFTFLVFYLIPLMKKLEAGRKKEPPSIVTETAVEPPEEFVVEDEPPPPPPPPPPEPKLVEQEDFDFTPDLLDLGSGPGTVLLQIPNTFAIDGENIDLGQDSFDQPPRASTRFDPRYPRNLLKRRIGGRVLVSMKIDERGFVIEARVKESSGYKELDRAAIAAAQRWKFKPGIKGGNKVVSTAVQPFTFRVK